MNESPITDVLVEMRGAVCWITINRPAARNALNADVSQAIRDGLLQASQNKDCRAIVLTGAGDKAFCAGADLVKTGGKSVFEVDFANPRHFMVGLLKQMDECPLPLIARVNGHAMAGGLGLVCACDLAVSTDSATSVARKRSVLQTLTTLLQSVTPEEQMEAAQRWGEYQEEVMQAMIGVPASSPPPIGQWLIKYRLQSHDLSHGSFTSERSLFRHSRLAVRVPTVLLHGAHDWVCPLPKCKPPAALHAACGIALDTEWDTYRF
jgi:hypothetical protein